MTDWTWDDIGNMPPEWGSQPDLDDAIDTDTRCTHHDATGQCLDHQGHLGRHQPPAKEV